MNFEKGKVYKFDFAIKIENAFSKFVGNKNLEAHFKKVGFEGIHIEGYGAIRKVTATWYQDSQEDPAHVTEGLPGEIQNLEKL